MGIVYLLKSNNDEAEKELNKGLEALQEMKIIPYSIINVAEYYAIKKDPTNSCKWLKKLIEMDQKQLFDYSPSIKLNKLFDNIRSSSCYQNIMKDK